MQNEGPVNLPGRKPALHLPQVSLRSEPEWLILERNLGYRISNRALFTRALSPQQNGLDLVMNSGALEKLGNSVLSVCLAIAIHQRVGNEWDKECVQCFLDPNRSQTLRNAANRTIFKSLSLPELLGNFEGSPDKTGSDLLINDRLGGILGAVFLDRGLSTAKAVVSRLFANTFPSTRKPSAFDYSRLNDTDFARLTTSLEETFAYQFQNPRNLQDALLNAASKQTAIAQLSPKLAKLIVLVRTGGPEFLINADDLEASYQNYLRLDDPLFPVLNPIVSQVASFQSNFGLTRSNRRIECALLSALALDGGFGAVVADILPNRGLASARDEFELEPADFKLASGDSPPAVTTPAIAPKTEESPLIANSLSTTGPIGPCIRLEMALAGRAHGKIDYSISSILVHGKTKYLCKLWIGRHMAGKSLNADEQQARDAAATEALSKLEEGILSFKIR